MEVTRFYANSDIPRYTQLSHADGHRVWEKHDDVFGHVTGILKPEGDCMINYDGTGTQVRGKWGKDGTYYNTSGTKSGHAGPDGVRVCGAHRPSPSTGTSQ